MFAHRIEVARRVAEPKAIGDLSGYTSEREVVARRLTDILRPQHVTEIGGRGSVELPEGLAGVLLLRARLDFPDLDPHAIGDQTHRRRPLHA